MMAQTLENGLGSSSDEEYQDIAPNRPSKSFSSIISNEKKRIKANAKSTCLAAKTGFNSVDTLSEDLLKITGLSDHVHLVLLKETGDVICLEHGQLMEVAKVPNHFKKHHPQRDISSEDLNCIHQAQLTIDTKGKDSYYANNHKRGPIPGVEIIDGHECSQCGLIWKTRSSMRRHFQDTYRHCREYTKCKYQDLDKGRERHPLKLKCHVEDASISSGSLSKKPESCETIMQATPDQTSKSSLIQQW
jgi:hypothetical protein